MATGWVLFSGIADEVVFATRVDALRGLDVVDGVDDDDDGIASVVECTRCGRLLV